MWRKIYIHTCQNKQRIAETILKCTKILKQDVVHQELRSNKAVGQIHFKEQTQKNRSDLWLLRQRQTQEELDEVVKRYILPR